MLHEWGLPPPGQLTPSCSFRYPLYTHTPGSVSQHHTACPSSRSKKSNCLLSVTLTRRSGDFLPKQLRPSPTDHLLAGGCPLGLNAGTRPNSCSDKEASHPPVTHMAPTQTPSSFRCLGGSPVRKHCAPCLQALPENPAPRSCRVSACAPLCLDSLSSPSLPMSPGSCS